MNREMGQASGPGWATLSMRSPRVILVGVSTWWSGRESGLPGNKGHENTQAATDAVVLPFRRSELDGKAERGALTFEGQMEGEKPADGRTRC